MQRKAARTNRCTRPGRHYVDPRRKVSPAGPAVEVWRSANESGRMDHQPAGVGASREVSRPINKAFLARPGRVSQHIVYAFLAAIQPPQMSLQSVDAACGLRLGLVGSAWDYRPAADCAVCSPLQCRAAALLGCSASSRSSEPLGSIRHRNRFPSGFPSKPGIGLAILYMGEGLSSCLCAWS